MVIGLPLRNTRYAHNARTGRERHLYNHLVDIHQVTYTITVMDSDIRGRLETSDWKSNREMTGKSLSLRRLRFSLLFLPVLALHAVSQAQNTMHAAANTVPITLGQSVVPLNGPWKFHTGDDPRWADPSFDDSAWETIDLTSPPGAHDADVGLTGYVPGWTAKGHSGYWGYAWYRMRVSVAAPPGDRLALAGPPDVDDAYQLFLNGQLLGSAGRFSGPTPVVYSIQPRMFSLPQSLLVTSPDSGVSAVLAFRVWMGAGTLGEAPDTGGIHIAPALGETGAVEARYRLQWLETVSGYIVEVVLPISFVLLAVMACSLMLFDCSDLAYLWLSAALVLTGLVRANQALYFWTQAESIQLFDLARNVFLVPLGLGAWTMAWRGWFRLRRPAWIPKAVATLTLLYMGSQLLSRFWFPSLWPHAVTGFNIISVWLRLLFALLLGLVVYWGIRQEGREGWLALPAVVLVSVGLFAQELNVLHVPGIWFPFGTGVSRAQFAYAAFDAAMFALLLRRLVLFAKLHQYRLALDVKQAQRV